MYSYSFHHCIACNSKMIQWLLSSHLTARCFHNADMHIWQLRILNLPYLNACFLHIPVLSDPFLYALFFSHFKFLSRYMVFSHTNNKCIFWQIAYQYLQWLYDMCLWKFFFFVELLNIIAYYSLFTISIAKQFGSTGVWAEAWKFQPGV